MGTNRSASSIGGSVSGVGRGKNEQATLNLQMTGGLYDSKKRVENLWSMWLEFSLSLIPATLVCYNNHLEHYLECYEHTRESLSSFSERIIEIFPKELVLEAA